MGISYSLHPILHFSEYLKICIRNSFFKSLNKQTKACELTACHAKALTHKLQWDSKGKIVLTREPVSLLLYLFAPNTALLLIKCNQL